MTGRHLPRRSPAATDGSTNVVLRSASTTTGSGTTSPSCGTGTERRPITGLVSRRRTGRGDVPAGRRHPPAPRRYDSGITRVSLSEVTSRYSRIDRARPLGSRKLSGREQEIHGGRDLPAEPKSELSGEPDFCPGGTSKFGFRNTGVMVGDSGRAFPAHRNELAGRWTRTGGL